MANDVAKFFGNVQLPSRDKLQQDLASLGAAKAGLMGGQALLRLTKVGQWVLGQESEAVHEGQQFIVNPVSVQTGYVAWWQGGIEGEVMQPLSMGPVDPDKLGPVNSGGIPPGGKAPSGRGWEDQVSVNLASFDGMQVVYRTNSLGGRRAILDLAGKIAYGYQENPKRFYPVIELSSDSYQHKNKEYGTIYNPILNIVAWLDENGKPVSDVPILDRPPLV